jgi:hypothetical protein|eukprot:COSAG01_NODE_1769_length_9272_cov_34.805298_9_plen_65_part_00
MTVSQVSQQAQAEGLESIPAMPSQPRWKGQSLVAGRTALLVACNATRAARADQSATGLQGPRTA